jgi:hypothetical protein
MMTVKQHAILKLIEECAEVQHQAAKLMQFGPDDKEPGQTQTNATRLRYELDDLWSAMWRIEELKVLRPTDHTTMKIHHHRKQGKVDHFLNYSRKLGTVEPAPSEDSTP